VLPVVVVELVAKVVVEAVVVVVVVVDVVAAAAAAAAAAVDVPLSSTPSHTTLVPAARSDTWLGAPQNATLHKKGIPLMSLASCALI
jgi:hypothetical protein